MIEDLLAAMKAAVGEVERWHDREVQILHHNDADGLSSGAILTRAFGRGGFEVQRVCLEKPYPAVLERIFDDEGRLIVLTDFAGRIAPLISELNRGRNLVLILDHHKAEAPTDERVHLLDPEFFGLRGDRDITASTTCYLFARTMNPDNRDLARIATIGAVGDRFFVDGRLAGPNREAALETRRQGMLEIVERDGGESYVLVAADGRHGVEEVARELDTLGGAGYHEGGPEVGIEVCLNGRSADSDAMVSRLRQIQDRAFAGELERIQIHGWTMTPHIQWIHVHERFMPMGVKMIGAFLDSIRNSDLVDPSRYLAAFQNVPNEIPGIGIFSFDQAKVSMRVADSMEDGIRNGSVLGLDILLPEATNRVGGFSDACHSLTAATTVALGREEDLITEMEDVLAGWRPEPERSGATVDRKRRKAE